MRYLITPVPKPRQTRSDKWKKRPCVMRYRAFADECRLKGVHVHDMGDTIIFNMPMPKSWSKSKKTKMNGACHQQKPDIDNLLKALLDATKKEDCTVWNVSTYKLWAHEGSIEIE